MATNLIINGVTYSFPTLGDVNWGNSVTAWATAITNGVLQKSGGVFQLLGEVDFGTSFGLKSLYYKSRATNPASTGVIRLGNTEQVNWRNSGNTADLGLTLNTSNQIESTAPILAPSLVTAGTITTPLSTGVVHSTAGVLTSSLIDDPDVSPTAAIARSKLASGTANHVLINDGTGVMASESSLSPTRGGTGQTSVTTGDIFYGTGTNTVGKLSIGTSNQVLAVTGGVPTWVTNPSGFADPMTSIGDFIYRDGTNTTARLPVGTGGQLLTVSGGVPVWSNTVTGALTLSNQAILGGTPTTPAANNIALGSDGAANRLVLRGENTRALTLSTASLTANRTLTAPDVTGTIITSADVGTITSTMILDGTIGDSDISASAGIQGSKILSASAVQPGVVDTGTQTFAGNKTLSGITTVSNSTASTSTTTGALVVTGGVGVGGRATVGGILAVTDGTASTSASTGSVQIGGGVGIAGQMNMTGDLRVGSNRGSDGAAALLLQAVSGAASTTAQIQRASGTNGNLNVLNTGTGVIDIRNSAGTSTGQGVAVQGYRNGALTAGYVGESYVTYASGSTALSSPATYTTVVTFTTGSGVLPVGVWLVSAQCFFANNSGSTTTLNCTLLYGADPEDLSFSQVPAIPTGNNLVLNIAARTIISNGSDALVLRARSTVGSASITAGNNNFSSIRAVRIA